MTASGAPARVVLAVCGLALEARIAGPGVSATASGGDARRLAAAIEREVSLGARALISFGIAGGLRPGLAAGTILVASGVQFDATSSLDRVSTDPRWSARLRDAIPEAVSADIVGDDRVLADVAAKHEWHARTGAAAVDMESHVVARIAAAHGLPFAVLRAIADEAGRDVPHSAIAGMRSDGSTDAFAVVAALLRRPAELPALVRAAFAARAALRALARSRARLDAGLNGADLDELLLHVV